MKERKIIKSSFPLNLITEIIFDNILIIGDPHVYQARPGRRRDESYFDTILDKLEQAKNIANRNNCYSIITGDFFHAKTDRVESEFVNRLIKLFKGFKYKPLILSGNHEKIESMITDKDALSIFENVGLVDVLDGNGLIGKIKLKNENNEVKYVAIGGTCFGETIPYDLTSYLDMEEDSSFRDEEEIKIYNEEKEYQNNPKIVLVTRSPKEKSNEELHKKIKDVLNVDETIWVTHHDLAFSENYPSSRPLHPIDGVDIMINGHMHNYKKPVKKGLTSCYNPGNIARVKIDEIENIPSVWMYNPFADKNDIDMFGLKIPKIERFVLNYKPYEEVFNMEGRNVKESNKDVEIRENNFIALMKQDSVNKKTDEAVFIKENMDNIMERKETSLPIRSYLMDVLSRVIEKEMGLSED